MSDLRFGVVGMGTRGRMRWLETLRQVPQARVVTVCDRIQALAAEGAARAGLAAADAYVDVDALLARADVDAVAVVVEPEAQPAIAERALAAGKHVVCEVPLAFSLQDCWRLVLAVERSGLKLAMAEQSTFSPFVRAWRRLVERGTLGKPLYAEAEYIHGMPANRYWIDGETGRWLSWEEAQRNPRAQKSRFWSMTHPIWYLPHSLGPLLRVLETRVTRVTCFGTRGQSYYLPELPIPDLEVALMRTADDAILRLAAGFIAPNPWPHHWRHLRGTLGEVETGRRASSGGSPREGMLWLADSYLPTRNDVSWDFTGTEPADPQAAGTGHDGRDYYPVRDFVESVLRDRQPVIDVYRAAEIAAPAVIAGMSAERDGVPLAVPDFRPGPHRRAGEPPAPGA